MLDNPKDNISEGESTAEHDEPTERLVLRRGRVVRTMKAKRSNKKKIIFCYLGLHTHSYEGYADLFSAHVFKCDHCADLRVMLE